MSACAPPRALAVQRLASWNLFKLFLFHYFLSRLAQKVLEKGVVMVLHVIGLGLGDCEDITVKGLTRVRSADAVFLECYTSVLGIDKDALVSLSLRRFTFNMMRIILERSFLPMFDFLLGMVPD